MSSATYTSAEALQAYVQDFGDQLISEIFFQFDTAQDVTVHENVKGRKTLTELVIGDNLVKRYRSQHDPVSGAVDFQPPTLITHDLKVDLDFVPKDFESSYLGQFRQPGQNPRDLPFEAMIMMKVKEAVHQEIEKAVWAAEATATPAALDNVNLVFDGFNQVIEDAVTATDVTATTTGAITASNIVTSVETVFDALADPYKMGQTTCFVSPQNFIRYMRKYRADFGKYTNPTNMREKLDFADCTLRATSGLTGSDKIIITPSSNLHIGIDGVDDYSVFNIWQTGRQVFFEMDFKLGVQIGLLKDGPLAVNEQA